jgi:hypothetical protein
LSFTGGDILDEFFQKDSLFVDDVEIVFLVCRIHQVCDERLVLGVGGRRGDLAQLAQRAAATARRSAFSMRAIRAARRPGSRSPCGCG